MSVRSITDLAVLRDATGHQEPVAASSGRRRGRAAEPAQRETTGDALISAIPTEIVATYTVVFGLVQPLIKNQPSSYVPLRWCLFAVGVVLTIVAVVIVYARKRAKDSTKRRNFPGAELASATVAFVAWALVMPGSALSAQLPDRFDTIVMGSITAVALLLLGFVTGQPLRLGSKTQT